MQPHDGMGHLEDGDLCKSYAFGSLIKSDFLFNRGFFIISLSTKLITINGWDHLLYED